MEDVIIEFLKKNLEKTEKESESRMESFEITKEFLSSVKSPFDI